MEMSEHKHEHEHDDGLTCHCHEHEHEHDDGLTCHCHEHEHEHDDGLTCHCHEHEHGHEEKGAQKKELIQIIAGALLFLSIVIINKVLGIEEYSLISILGFFAVYVLLGGRIVWSAVKNIFHGEIFDENFLMSVATIGALVIREYPEAVGVMLFFRIGEFFEEVAVKRSRSQIMEAVDLRPEVVNRMEGDEVLVIPAENAKVGDILLVRPGDRIPLDGIVTEGESRIDTSAVTGEPVPVKVAIGSPITSGCINENGVLKIRVEKELSDSMVSKILNSVQNAAANKPKIDQFIKRFAKIYTPIVVAIALITAIVIPLVSGQEFYPWVYTALSFLVMSCPCAVVISVPLAFFCGIGASSKQGILFKGGIVMEALAKIKAVVMDKTGTITKGNFVLQKILKTSDMPEEEMLFYAACCEQLSTHPIAVSIVKAAERKVELLRPEKIEEVPGKGIHAVIDGKEVLCGNYALMEEYAIFTEKPEQEKQEAGAEVYLAVDNIFVGCFVISDTIKIEAPEAVAKLKHQNIRTAMLTGDAEEAAREIADKAGVEEVHARLLPQDKLSELIKIRENHGRVMFVGDGINDAPVLAGADVGAAMGSGADAAIEAADVVFMNSNMDAIPEAIRLSKKTSRIARQNVIFAIAIKCIVMLLGISGIYSNMWLAVFADTGVAFLCILNSIRIMYRIKTSKR